MEKLFEGEYKLMEVLWDAGAVNSTHLVELCREKLGWNKSTTYTVLRRLKNKGALRHENTVVTPVVERVGGLSLFMTAFLSGRKLTREEAEELKRLIDEKMGEG